MQRARIAAEEAFKKAISHYDCGGKNLRDFPRNDGYGVLHCMLGNAAKGEGAGYGCLSAANVGWEAYEVFFTDEVKNRGSWGDWYDDTFDDMTDVFTGAQLGSPEDCIPCECKKKKPKHKGI